MRKGTKRKTAAAAAAARKTTQKEEGLKESTKAVSRAKRVKATKPESEPEYFEDQRNLEDLWKEVFPVGTEWDQLDLVYKFKWDFSNLENAFEEGGKLYGQKVYLFGSTEPQLIPVKGENKMIIIPVVVAVVSPFPPSDKIGINSVQRVKEDIVPMKQMKMDWVPYIPLENRDSQVDKLKSQIYILSCTQRRTALKRLKIERVKEYEYCLPYFFDPSKEDDDDLDSRVDISYPEEEPTTPFPCEFDWEFDELEDFTVKLIEGGYLTEDQKASFKEHVKEKVRGKKKAYKEAKQSRKKVIDDMGEEKKAAIKAIKFYKFYPVATPDTPDVSSVKAHYINRYYGKAHEVL